MKNKEWFFLNVPGTIVFRNGRFCHLFQWARINDFNDPIKSLEYQGEFYIKADDGRMYFYE